MNLKHCMMIPLLLALAACAGIKQQQADSLGQSREIGVLIKSVAVDAEVFQRQRDAIAVTSQRQRNALETLALEQEADWGHKVADWNIAGDAERKRMFDTVRSETDKLLAGAERRAERARQHQAELARVRSAVQFNQEKINEAAGAMLRLGEPATALSQASFLFKFARDVRADVIKEAEAEVAAQAAKAATPVKGSTP